MSDIGAISSTTSATAAAQGIGRLPVQTLGQEEFIKILVTQLTSQDPMNPQKDTEFIAQMAQFSQLESNKTLASELTSMRQQQDFLSASSMIGRTVEFDDGDASHTGTVTGVEMREGKPFIVAGEHIFGLGDVVRVEPSAK
jgi:flagellar basal-body rod modification protein FlgD